MAQWRGVGMARGRSGKVGSSRVQEHTLLAELPTHTKNMLDCRRHRLSHARQ